MTDTVAVSVEAPVVFQQPPGGNAGQVYRKNSDTSFDGAWEDVAALDFAGSGETTSIQIGNRYGIDAGELNVRGFYQGNPTLNDRDAFIAALTALQTFSTGGSEARLIVPAGKFDLLDGNLGTITGLTSADIVGFGQATQFTVSALGANGGLLFDLSNCVQVRVRDIHISYGTGLALTKPCLRLNGGADNEVRGLQVNNAYGLLAIGDVASSSRNTFRDIYSGGWRGDLNGDYIQLCNAKNTTVETVRMNAGAGLHGTGAFIHLIANGALAQIDTGKFDDCTMQSVGNGSQTDDHNLYAILMEVLNGGEIFNMRFIGGAYDHCLNGVKFRGDATGGSMRHIKMIGVRMTVDAGHVSSVYTSGPVYHWDWQTPAGNNMDFSDVEIENGAGIFTGSEDPIVVEAPAVSANFPGARLLGGSLRNSVAAGTTPPTNCFRAGGQFYMLGTTFEKSNSGSPSVQQVGTFTNNIERMISNNKFKGLASPNLTYFNGENPYTGNKIVTDNIGLTPSADTARNYILASAAASSDYRPETLPLLVYLASIGITMPSGQKTKYDTFIGALVDAGIWGLGNQCWYLLSALNEVSALCNLFDPGGETLVKSASGLTWGGQSTGYTGDGVAGYLAGPAPAGLGLTQNNMTAVVWVGNNVAANTEFAMGGDLTNVFRINPKGAAGHPSIRANDTTDSGSLSPASSIGLFGFSRGDPTFYTEIAASGGVHAEATVNVASTGMAGAMNFLQASTVYDGVHQVRGGGLCPALNNSQRAALTAAFAAYMS